MPYRSPLAPAGASPIEGELPKLSLCSLEHTITPLLRLGSLCGRAHLAVSEIFWASAIPKRGYRFIAEVAVVDLHDRSSEVQSAAETTMGPAFPKPHRSRTRRIAVATVACLGLVVGVSWLAFSLFHRPVRIRSLTVLPLDNFSGDPSQDYLADGTTDELITDLAQVRALRASRVPR